MAATSMPISESKTRAERRAWEIVSAAGRRADLVAINPSVILGPLLDDDPGTSAALISRLLNGGIPAAPRMPSSSSTCATSPRPMWPP